MKMTVQSAVAFTLICKAWAFQPGEFDSVDPLRIKLALRKHLCELVKTNPKGWLFAHLEASYDPVQQCYQFHFHGIATGDYIKALNVLRKKKGFKPWKEAPGLPKCGTPVKLEPINVADVANQASYPIKSFWKVRKGGERVRLPGIEHTRSLLFLDKWRLEDLSLLIGITVKDGRLQQTNRKGA